jgi:hypothetical protein
LIWSLSAENKKPPTDRVDPLRALSIYRQLHMLALAFTIAGLALLTDFFDETYRTA